MTNENHLYRLRHLASTPGKPGILPVGPASVWRWVRNGKFPKPYVIGERCTVWDKATVDQWLAIQREGAQQ